MALIMSELLILGSRPLTTLLNITVAGLCSLSLKVKIFPALELPSYWHKYQSIFSLSSGRLYTRLLLGHSLGGCMIIIYIAQCSAFCGILCIFLKKKMVFISDIIFWVGCILQKIILQHKIILSADRPSTLLLLYDICCGNL